jgi:hypothetical protein
MMCPVKLTTVLFFYEDEAKMTPQPDDTTHNLRIPCGYFDGRKLSKYRYIVVR